jgi:flagellar hook-associated protein 2
VELEADDTLEDLVGKLNELPGNFHAALVQDPTSSTPYRLSLVSSASGRAGSITLDDGGLGLGITEIVEGRDAVIALGAHSAGTGALVTSSTNNFENAVNGLSVTIKSESTEAVTVTVATDPGSISSKVKLFVDQYNKLQDKLKTLDFYNADDGSKGVLFGSSEVLQIRANLSRGVAQRYFANTKYQNISSLGVTFTADNKLQFDADKFAEAYAADAEAVKSFFTNETQGFAKSLDTTAENLVGIKNSTLVARAQALQTTVDGYTERISFLNERLSRSRERLLNTFYKLETSIAKLQNSFGSISNSLTNAINAARSNQ